MNISTVNELIQSLESAGMNNEIEQIAQQNDMSVEFVTWFFNEKKAVCGNVWFMMMAAMWEGWKGRSIEMDKLAAENVVRKNGNGTAIEFRDFYAWWNILNEDGLRTEEERMLAAGAWMARSGLGNTDEYQYVAPETPTTDRIVAGIKADGVESGIKTIITMLNHQAPGISDAINVLRVHCSEMREWAGK